jgi:hypothetical protein
VSVANSDSDSGSGSGGVLEGRRAGAGGAHGFATLGCGACASPGLGIGVGYRHGLGYGYGHGFGHGHGHGHGHGLGRGRALGGCHGLGLADGFGLGHGRGGRTVFPDVLPPGSRAVARVVGAEPAIRVEGTPRQPHCLHCACRVSEPSLTSQLPLSCWRRDTGRGWVFHVPGSNLKNPTASPAPSVSNSAPSRR